MNIIKFEKIGKQKYKIYFDNEELILYEDVIIKYNLLSKKEVDLNFLDKVLKDNSFYEIYNNALNYIEIKMRSKKELYNYLLKKEYNSTDIDKVIKKLEEEDFINDKKFIQAFVNDRISLTLYGPLKIKRELINLDIDENEIDNYLSSIDEAIWIEKANKIISKKNKSNKKLSSVLFKKKLLEDLYFLGYNKEQVLSLIENIDVDESQVLNVEFKKAYNKFSKKYDQSKINKYIKDYLIKKGFSYESISEEIDIENEY